MATLSSDKTYVTVVKGDTLSEIAEKYGSYIAGTGIYGSNGKLATLVKINDITDSNFIVVGQRIKLTGSSTSKKNTTSKATIKQFGVQSNSGGRTMYATWKWDKANTDSYEIRWYYATGDGIWFEGSNGTVKIKQCTYSAPSNATRVKFKVKPVSKKRKVNGKETSYWTASWSTEKTYSFASNPPTAPSSFDVKIENTTLTVTLDNIGDLNATHIEFQVVRNNSSVYKTGKAAIKTAHASFSCTIATGNEYKVRCRAVRGKLVSDWTEYSSNETTIPAAPSKITECSATTVEGGGSGVYLKWTSVKTATGYTIEYALDKSYFDHSTMPTSVSVSQNVNWWTITGLDVGQEYFFRVRAENGEGSSKWSPIASVILGTAPSSPTTWSSTNTVVAGERLTLYWVHNSEDNSAPSQAKIKFSIVSTGPDDQEYEIEYEHPISYDGSELEDSEVTVKDESGGIISNFIQGVKDWVGGIKEIFSGGSSNYTPEENEENNENNEENPVCSYEITTSDYVNGAEITWSVCTAGTKKEGNTFVFSEYSMPRIVSIYIQPNLSINTTTDLNNKPMVDDIESFPLYVLGSVDAGMQKPIGYYISITAGSSYDTVDDVGNYKMISAGDSVYSKYIDTDTDLVTNIEPEALKGIDMSDLNLAVEISASDIDLENNVEYTVNCTVAMDSGLSADASYPFTVKWSDYYHEPNAEIAIDPVNVTASIRPYCEYEDENGNLVLDPNVLLSVYRRQYDGKFVELQKDIKNDNTFITDPHPALDFARYRIVARSTDTGSISYYDVPGHPVGEKGIILQWDETWSDFNIDNEELTEEDIANEREEPTWAGSFLRLLYNIDVSSSYAPDVALINYAGRTNPVSYYGTHTGETATWSLEIDKSDKETLYALRRLAVWMGDVYVREPSGSGYWANVTVSFSQTHCEVTIPVSLSIKRVEGGA